MQRLPKEPAEQTPAALVLFFRSVTLSFLVLPLLTVLFQLVVIEQQIPFKRIVYQIEQVVVIKRDRSSNGRVNRQVTLLRSLRARVDTNSSYLRLSIARRNACATERLQIR